MKINRDIKGNSSVCLGIDETSCAFSLQVCTNKLKNWNLHRLSLAVHDVSKPREIQDVGDKKANSSACLCILDLVSERVLIVGWTRKIKIELCYSMGEIAHYKGSY